MFIVFVQSDVPCTRKQILKHELETFVFIIPFIFSPMTTNFFFLYSCQHCGIAKTPFFFFPCRENHNCGEAIILQEDELRKHLHGFA